MNKSKGILSCIIYSIIICIITSFVIEIILILFCPIELIFAINGHPLRFLIGYLFPLYANMCYLNILKQFIDYTEGMEQNIFSFIKKYISIIIFCFIPIINICVSIYLLFHNAKVITKLNK